MNSFFKHLLAFAIVASCLFTGCTDYGESIKPAPVQVTKPVVRDSLSLVIQRNTDFVKTITADTNYSDHAGIRFSRIAFINKQDKPITLYIVEVDLQTPGLSIEVATPDNLPTASSKQKLSEMIKARNSASAGQIVLAGINGDFFDTSTGTPLGPVYQRGNPIRTFMSSGYHFFGMLKNQNYTIGNYSAYQNQQARLVEVIGGRHRLLRDGEPVTHADLNVHPRTSLGLVDKKKAVILVVDGRQPEHSVGFTLNELGSTLKALGVKDAVNMDGGGSSTLITKDAYSRYQIQNRLADGAERAVANGLLILRKG